MALKNSKPSGYIIGTFKDFQQVTKDLEKCGFTWKERIGLDLIGLKYGFDFIDGYNLQKLNADIKANMHLFDFSAVGASDSKTGRYTTYFVKFKDTEKIKIIGEKGKMKTKVTLTINGVDQEVEINLTDDQIKSMGVKINGASVWKPKYGNSVFFNDINDGICETSYDDDFHEDAYDAGQLFNTESDAEFALAKAKAVTTYKRMLAATTNAMDWSDGHQPKFYAFWNGKESRICVGTVYTKKGMSVYTTDESAIVAAISAIGNAGFKKYILEV